MTFAEDKPFPPVFRLSNELLLKIAEKLIVDRQLGQLSLVNSKFRSIAQDALYRNVIVSRCAIPKLVDTLCDRSGLATKVHRMSVHDCHEYDCKSDLHTQQTDQKSGWPSQNLREILQRYEMTMPEEAWTSTFAALEKDMHGNGDSHYKSYLNILVCLLPNMKHCTMRLPKKPDPEQRGVTASTLHTPFPSLATKLLATQLQTLDIPNAHILGGTYPVNFVALENVVRLSLPLNALCDEVGTTIPKNTLPRKLRSLRVLACHKFTWYWILRMSQACSNQELPSLQKLDLCFDTCITSSLIMAQHGHTYLKTIRRPVQESHDLMRLFLHDLIVLRQNGVTVKYCSPNNQHRTGNFEEEIGAFLYLTPFEAWATAQKGLKFSETVARDARGAPRRSTKPEIRSFLRYNDHLRNLGWFFIPRVRLNRVSPVFGTDMRPVVSALDCVPDLEVWKNIRAAVEKPISEITPDPVAPTILPQHNPGVSVYDFPTSKHALSLPELNVLDTKFQADRWDEVVFFEARKVQPALRDQSQKQNSKAACRKAAKPKLRKPKIRRVEFKKT